MAGIVFQHESVESPVRELNRNPALLGLCGPLDYQDKPKVEVGDDDKLRTTSPEPRSTVPGSHNFSRFLSSLIKIESRDPDVMVRQLREQLELPDFGEHFGGKAVDSHSTGQISRKTGKAPDADWGKHETTGVDGNRLWTKVKSWFCYGLHADTKIPAGITRASRSEVKELDVDRLGNADAGRALQGLQRGSGERAAQGETGVRHSTRLLWRENDPDPDNVRPLFDDNVTERGEVLCR